MAQANVGVGRMGGPMCHRLIEARNSFAIFDKASFPTPSIVEAAALGPQGVIEGSRVNIFIDVSTTGSTYAKRNAEGLKTKNIVAVDAPASGGIAGAEKEGNASRDGLVRRPGLRGGKAYCGSHR